MGFDRLKATRYSPSNTCRKLVTQNSTKHCPEQSIPKIKASFSIPHFTQNRNNKNRKEAAYDNALEENLLCRRAFNQTSYPQAPLQQSSTLRNKWLF